MPTPKGDVDVVEVELVSKSNECAPEGSGKFAVSADETLADAAWKIDASPANGGKHNNFPVFGDSATRS